jgi:hypothetical protein
MDYYLALRSLGRHSGRRKCLTSSVDKATHPFMGQSVNGCEAAD